MKMSNKKIIIDLDNTLTIEGPEPYLDKKPNTPVIAKLKQYRLLGYEIIIYTARNMKSYDGDVSKINSNTLPIIFNWLERHEVPYNGVLVGKPWCGNNGFWVDDRAIRPDEFVKMTHLEVLDLLDGVEK